MAPALSIVAALAGCVSDDEPNIENVEQDSTPVAATVVDVTPGRFDVDDSGNATYAIPIWVSPGRNGLQPTLSLRYNSSGGNGIAGQGWGLTGMPRITRCRESFAVDGRVRAVTYGTSGPFCLDGERLIPTGTDEYRTERDDIAKITSTRNATDGGPSGPSSFHVFEKNGNILTFGGAAEAIVEGARVSEDPVGEIAVTETSANVRIAWALSAVTDRSNNDMVVHYTRIADPNDANAVEVLPSKIEYARPVLSPGSNTVQATYDTTYSRRVDLQYETRSDPSIAFVNGVKSQLTRRLTSIKSYGPGNTLLRQFNLHYQSTSPSVLSAVQECDPVGACKKPTTFSYEPANSQYQDLSTGIRDVRGAYTVLEQLLTLDIDGDGRDDILYRRDNGDDTASWVYRLSTGSGFGSEQAAPMGVDQWDLGGIHSGNDGQALDFNLDGRADVIKWLQLDDPTSGRHRIYYSTGNGFTYSASDDVAEILAGPVYRTIFAGDLTGDGYPELLRPWTANDHYDWAVRRNAAGVLASAYEHLDLTFEGFGAITDVDGDGAEDVLTSDDGTRMKSFKLGTTSGYVQRTTTLHHDDGSYYVFVDVNGDGLADAIQTPTYGGMRFGVAINTGNGFRAPIQYVVPDGYRFTTHTDYTVLGEQGTAFPTAIDNGMRVVDYDGDGRQDLLLMDDGYESSLTKVYDPGKRSTRNTIRVIRFTGAGVPEYEDTGIPVGEESWGWKLSKTLDLDGDGLMDIAELRTDGLHIYKHLGDRPRILTQIVEGYGNSTRIFYSPLTDTRVYRPFVGACAAGQLCLTRGLNVVREHWVEGPGGWRKLQHVYEDARADVGGRGFLGFAKHTIFDYTRGASTQRWFDNRTKVGTRYPYAGLPNRELVITDVLKVGSGLESTTGKHALDRRTTYTYASTVGSAFFVRPGTVTTTETDQYGATRTQTTRYGYDSYANTTWEERTSAGRLYRRDLTYTNDSAAWLIGLLTRDGEYDRAPDNSSVARVMTYGYNARGFVAWTKQEPENPTAGTYVYTTLDYDGAGMLVSERTTDMTGQSRRTTYTYEPTDHVFVRTQENAAGHTITTYFHQGLGVVVRSVDANSLTTQRNYDWFGRVTRETAPTGAYTTYDYDASPYGAWQVTEARSDGATHVTHFDAYNDEIRREDLAIDGRWAGIATTYDVYGRVATVSQPHFRGETPAVTTYTYDGLDRLTRVVQSDGGVVTYQSVLYSTCRTDAEGHRTCRQNDDTGLLTATVDYDASGAASTTRFTYGPFSTLKRVTDPNGNLTTARYDTLGRVIAFDDPDSNEHTTEYNGYGEIAATVDGRGRRTAFARDLLGRPILVSTPDGYESYSWDPQYAKGALGAATSATGVFTKYEYNLFGRLWRQTWTINGASYEIARYYDSLGRVTSVNYPAVGTSRFIAYSEYAPTGELKRVYGNDNYTYWRVDARNAAGEITKETFANGVTSTRSYDPESGFLKGISTSSALESLQSLSYDQDLDGNITFRGDAVAGSTETFTYDHLERLKRWQYWRGGLGSSFTYSYDAIGNLLEKHRDYGTFGETIKLTYGDASRPHAVTNSGTIPGNFGLQIPVTYGYDENGDQTYAVGRGTVDYTYFSLPMHVERGSGDVDFKYDASNGRVLKSRADGTSTVTLDGLYERRGGGTTTTHVFYVTGERGPVAQVLWNESGGSVASVERDYLHDDHIGSIETISNSSGRLFARQKFQPFGERMTTATDAVNLGFTGHEHDDELGMINMRGRVYDTRTSRFMTRDPLITGPAHSQSYNPYSYVLNNPLRLVDPSGFGPEDGSGGDSGLEGDDDYIGKTAFEISSGQPTITSTVLGAYIDFSNAPTYVVNAQSTDDNGTLNLPTPAEIQAGFAASAAERERIASSRHALVLPENPYAITQASADAFVSTSKTIASGGVVAAITTANAAAGGAPIELQAKVANATAAATNLLPNFSPGSASAGVGPTPGKAGPPPSPWDVHPFNLHRTFKPGPFAGESIPARSTARDFTPAERAAINRIGRDTGCHTCGVRDPGTKSGNHIPDHQGASALVPPGTPQQLYPHCLSCSKEQGLAIANLRRQGRL